MQWMSQLKRCETTQTAKQNRTAYASSELSEVIELVCYTCKVQWKAKNVTKSRLLGKKYGKHKILKTNFHW